MKAEKRKLAERALRARGDDAADAVPLHSRLRKAVHFLPNPHHFCEKVAYFLRTAKTIGHFQLLVRQKKRKNTVCFGA